MSLVEASISVSVDGFITGLDEHGAGLGRGGDILHYWFTKDPAGPGLLDDALFDTAGAVVTSRKVYEGMDGWGRVRLLPDAVFVLTHHPHDIVVRGETTFTFVTDGIESAVTQARAAARGRNVHIMGGASIIQQALAAGLVDSLQLHLAPVVLAAGTRLFENLTYPVVLERTETVESRYATHLRFRVISDQSHPHAKSK